MTKEEMLGALKTNEPEFNSYIGKYSNFLKSLTPGEAAIHKQIQPPVRPLEFLHHDVQPGDIQTLLAAAPSLLNTVVQDSNNPTNNPSGPSRPHEG